MTSFEDIKRIASQIEFLLNAEYPLHKALRASAHNVPPVRTDFDIQEYLKKADEYQNELREIAKSKPDEFAALVKETKFREMGPLLTIAESADFIAQTLYLDDGYPEIATKQRAQCVEEYNKIIQDSILAGRLVFINPHIKEPFDHARLSTEHLPSDGLLQRNRLYLCLQLKDAKYENRFPKPPKAPPPISKAPPPITPLTLTGVSSIRDKQTLVGIAKAEQAQAPTARPQPASVLESDDDKDGDGKYPWVPTARSIAEEILPKNRKHNLLTIAKKVREMMVQRLADGAPGTHTGRGGKVPNAGTIKRHALTGLK